MAPTKKTHPGTPQKGRGSNSTAQGRNNKAKPAAGSRKPPSQRPKRKFGDPDLKEPDYVEDAELRRGRSRTVTNKDSETAAEHPKRSSPRKDSMASLTRMQLTRMHMRMLPNLTLQRSNQQKPKIAHQQQSSSDFYRGQLKRPFSNNWLVCTHLWSNHQTPQTQRTFLGWQLLLLPLLMR
jgi:hypothetical protein